MGDVTEADCMASHIMGISATISGGAVGTRLNNCSTPQMIWESRLFSLNGMAAMVEEAQRVTSAFFHKYHEASWETPDLVPPEPTGAFFHVVNQVARNDAPKLERFWTVDDYGMNYISKSSLGSGATIMATLPPAKTGNFTEPQEEKAHCQTASEFIASGEDPMPLSATGKEALDWAIMQLTIEAR